MVPVPVASEYDGLWLRIAGLTLESHNFNGEEGHAAETGYDVTAANG
jgi:hypothetical protein